MINGRIFSGEEQDLAIDHVVKPCNYPAGEYSWLVRSLTYEIVSRDQFGGIYERVQRIEDA